MDSLPAPDRARRAFEMLGPKMKAFLLADAALLLAFLVVLVMFLTGSIGGSPAAADAPSATKPEATAPAATPDASTSTDTTSFRTPSGNIACEMTTDAATCTIANSSATPPVDASCNGVVGLELKVTADGASKPCVEGTHPSKAADDVPELAYGQAKTVGDFTCTSSSTGMKCIHGPSGKGFKLAKAGSELL
ncbi:hypothetical protein [Pengzhenrongella sp.]|jgi:hypothetical protein|uniref:hypothetical protein n=1 Tax=Pengzhenrongella sp. TaxID=2888820 RepID=UPI002F931FE7